MLAYHVPSWLECDIEFSMLTGCKMASYILPQIQWIIAGIVLSHDHNVIANHSEQQQFKAPLFFHRFYNLQWLSPTCEKFRWKFAKQESIVSPAMRSLSKFPLHVAPIVLHEMMKFTSSFCLFMLSVCVSVCPKPCPNSPSYHCPFKFQII